MSIVFLSNIIDKIQNQHVLIIVTNLRLNFKIAQIKLTA